MPEHQVAYESVRKLSLFGHFSPGHPVPIQGLADQLNAGMTPIREAIRRLTAEHELEALGNRRVCVPSMTAAKLEELYFVREFIEPQLAARAAKNISKTDIKRLEAKNIEVDRALELGDIPRYLENNYYFHFEL
jgi:DNA-binding GntR family transcriptional regulator